MKVGIIAASGKSGKAITKIALEKGYDVVGIVRHPEKMTEFSEFSNYETRIGDLNDINSLKKVCFDVDILISAYGPSLNQPAQHDKHAETLINLLIEQPKIKRLLVIGGVGSLLNDQGQMIFETDMYLPEWKADGSKQVNALKLYRQSKINWTYFSPAFWYEPDLSLTTNLIYGTDYLLYNQSGESKLGYLDTAMILIKEIKEQKYLQKRFTACRA